MHGQSQQVGRLTIESTGEAVHNVDAGGTRPPSLLLYKRHIGRPPGQASPERG